VSSVPVIAHQAICISVTAQSSAGGVGTAVKNVFNERLLHSAASVMYVRVRVFFLFFSDQRKGIHV
jgi:hypothetical protein